MALSVKPSKALLDFVKSIPDSSDIPPILQKIRESNEVEPITCGDLRWIRNHIHKVVVSNRFFLCIITYVFLHVQTKNPTVFLHQLIEGSAVELPTLPPPPPRSKELEARIERLKKEQEWRQYEQMVMNVSSKKTYKDDSFAAESK